MDDATRPAISVLIPVYNEAGGLEALRAELAATLDAIGRPWEVVFADDGSSDGSGAELAAIAGADRRFRVVELRRNYGQTAAIMAALDHSRGDVVVMLDADLQNDPRDIARLVAKLDEGYDVVSGWRVDRRDREFGRKLPSWAANRVIAGMSGLEIHDIGCTLKAYRRWTLENVRLYGEMHRFIPLYAAWEGARVTEIPVAHRERRQGQSKYGLGRAPRVLLDLLVLFFFDRAMDRPMQFFGLAGLWLFAASFGVGMLAIWLKLYHGVSFILTPLPLLCVTLAIGALICMLMGVLAEMLMRIYFEGRGRRAYVVRRTLNLDPPA
jgi:dolichol-phosphate mannosyltransferase